MTEALRSPGSTLKPFIYAMAFGDGVAHPETLLDDSPMRYGAWKPVNFDDKFHGSVTARQALRPVAQPAGDAIAQRDRSGAFRRAGAQRRPDSRSAERLRRGPCHWARRPACGCATSPGFTPPLRAADLRRSWSKASTTPACRWRRAGSWSPGAWQVADILASRRRPTMRRSATAFKTGTSYGYRDALAIGFDHAHTVAVWVGRADNGAVAGLIGRQVAAPILFGAFARIGGANEPPPRPPGVLVATTANLPPPLRHLRRDGPKILSATFANPLKITFPPDGARHRPGLLLAAAAGEDKPELALKAQGGAPPLTWMVNGAPLNEAANTQSQRHETRWTPDGAGFARASR